MKAIEILRHKPLYNHIGQVKNKFVDEAIKELEDLQEYLDEVKDCGWCKEHRAIIQWDKTDPRINR